MSLAIPVMFFLAIEEIQKHLPLKMKKKNISIEVYTNTDQQDDTESATILVTNIPEEVDEEHLEMFFENKRRFGDIRVVTIQLDQEEGSAVIEFENPNGNFHF